MPLTLSHVLLAVGGALTVPSLLGLRVAADTLRLKDSARAFLTNSLEVTTADVQRLDSGQVVSRTVGVSDRREVATLGIVRIRITPEFYVQRLVDITSLKRDEAILQIGTFRNPPDVRDVERLTLDDADVRSLRACRVGDCGVQLSEDAIERFRRDIDWERADASRQANRLMREILVDYVAEYQNRGSAASMRYADRAVPLDLANEFVSLLESDNNRAWRGFPALRRHLFEYPKNAIRGSIDRLYWSKEKVGRKGVVSITHLAICPAADSAVEYAIASKQIYGTHYFDASLGLTILVRDPSTPAATYLAYLNRSRVDVFEGMFGSLVRRVVTSKARSTVADQLAHLQRTLECQFATTRTR